MVKALSKKSCSLASDGFEKVMIKEKIKRNATRQRPLLNMTFPPSGQSLHLTGKCRTPSAEKQIDFILLLRDV